MKKLTGNTGIAIKEIFPGAHAKAVIAILDNDSGAIDSFGAQRVSQPTTLFDSSLTAGSEMELWFLKVTNTSGSAAVTYSASKAAVAMTVGAGDEIIRQTRRYFHYQPGKSQKVVATFICNNPVPGLTQEAGYGDDRNGVYYRTDGSNVEFLIRSSTGGSISENVVRQDSWNLDKLNGSGESGITLSPSSGQIFITDLEWLGLGEVRVGFVINNVPKYVHKFRHSNLSRAVYMETATLPFRYRISGNSALAGTASMSQICTTIISEGGDKIAQGLPRVGGRMAETAVVGSTERVLCSLRPKLEFNGRTNRIPVFLEGIEVYSDDYPVLYRVRLGASVTGGTGWVTPSDLADSVFEVETTASALATSGILISAGVVPSTRTAVGLGREDLNSWLPLSLDIDGQHPSSAGGSITDILVITAQTLSVAVGNTDCTAIAKWREFR